MKKVLLTGMIELYLQFLVPALIKLKNARADFMKLKGSWEISV